MPLIVSVCICIPEHTGCRTSEPSSGTCKQFDDHSFRFPLYLRQFLFDSSLFLIFFFDDSVSKNGNRSLALWARFVWKICLTLGEVPAILYGAGWQIREHPIFLKKKNADWNNGSRTYLFYLCLSSLFRTLIRGYTRYRTISSMGNKTLYKTYRVLIV